jgi:amino acid transporter
LAIVLILAVSGGEDAVKQLASATSLLLLCSFIVVNTSLIALKLRPGEPPGAFEVPVFVPVLGVVINATLIFARLSSPGEGTRAPLLAGIIVAFITALFFVIWPKNVTEEVLATIEEES